MDNGAGRPPLKSPDRGEKRAIDQLEDDKRKEENVHSANAWEQANLGDDERKQKFLRLMGAGKKQHHGRFVIGDTNTVHTKAEDSERKTRAIEEQYLEGMEHKLGTARHAGLGFHTDADSSEQKTADSTSSSDNNKQSEKKPEPDKKEDSVKDEKTDSKPGKEESPKTGDEKEKEIGIKKLSFVKSSS